MHFNFTIKLFVFPLQLWNFKADGYIFSSFCIQTSVAMKNTNVFLVGCHDKRLYCLESSADTVALRWTQELDSPVFSTPFVFPVVTSPKVNKGDETKLGTSNSDKHIVTYMATVASTKGKVYVLDMDFGAVKCSYQLSGEVFSSAVVHGNYIYVGCRDNHVYSLAMTVP